MRSSLTKGGRRRGVASADLNLGVVALYAGDLESARRLTGEAVEVFRELGDRQGFVSSAVNAGYVAYLDGDDETGRGLFHEALATARRIGARRLMAYAILGLAFTATRTGASLCGATLHGVVDEMFAELGVTPEALEAKLREADHGRLRDALGDDGFDAAYRTGRAMHIDDALNLASRLE